MNEDRVHRTVSELTVNVLGRPTESTVEAYREWQEKRDHFQEAIWNIISEYTGEDVGEW
jgi:hypothetical protein